MTFRTAETSWKLGGVGYLTAEGARVDYCLPKDTECGRGTLSTVDGTGGKIDGMRCLSME